MRDGFAKAIVVVGLFLAVLGLVAAVWLSIVWSSIELKVAGVALGLTALSLGMSYIFSAIAANDATNTDQRLDEIEARLDGIERSLQTIDSRPLPKGWVRALFYETHPTASTPATDVSSGRANEV